jgi:hypothetical protein
MIFRNLIRRKENTELKILIANQEKLYEEILALKLQLGNIQVSQMNTKGTVSSLNDVEFKVNSQFGDDGIIQYLINNIDIPVKCFIEFGVQDYSESNTRFLLINNYWKGLIIDGDIKDMEALKKKELYWRYDLTAIGLFINRNNINRIFKDNGFEGEIGILSIDIDGNDYWIWEAIDSVNPVIVIIEYNSVFGKNHAITIPYDENFYRTKAHYSNLYWGASLKALVYLANKKGFYFIGCNSAGNNAYFVRSDKLGGLRKLNVEEGFVNSKFRESRDHNGNLTFISGDSRIRQIEDCEVYDVEKNRVIRIRELY